MKKTLFLFLSLFCFSLFTPTAKSQVCNPNPAFTGDGVYPDSATGMVEGCAGDYYEEIFTINAPPDTVLFGFTFTINWMRVDNVSGMPPGLSYACNPVGCQIVGGQSGCAICSGNTNVANAGTWPITINVTIEAYHPTFGTQVYSYPINDYRIVLHPKPSVTITPNGAPLVVCSAGAVALDGGAGFANYQWFNNGSPLANDTLQNYSPMTTDDYSVMVTDGNGCSNYDTVSVLVDTMLFTPGHDDATCGNSDGKAWVAVSGAGPFTYSWNPVTGTTDTIFSLGAGAYEAQVTNALGCTDSVTISVSNLGGPVLDSIVTTDVSCFGDSNGTAEIFFSGGSGPFTYVWSNLESTAQAISLSAGTANITVTDNNNCLLVGSTTINEPTQLTVSMSATDETIGMNNGTASATPGGGTPPYTYAWSNAGTTSTITGLTGNANFIVTITDANGCTTTDTVFVGAIASIHSQQDLLKAIIYPNPSQGQFALSADLPFGGILTLNIYDYTGRMIHSEKLNSNTGLNTWNINLGDEHKGIFLAEISFGTSKQVMRIIAD